MIYGIDISHILNMKSLNVLRNYLNFIFERFKKVFYMKSFKIDVFDNTQVNIDLSENFHNTFADGTIFIKRNLCDWQSAKAIVKSSRFKETLKELNIEIIHIHAISAFKTKTNSENWSWSIRWKKINE